MSTSKTYRIWMLSPVPDVRFGRWWTAIGILLIGFAVYGLAAWLAAQRSGYFGRFPWTITLFFVAAIAYIVPMFHYIVERTHQALDALGPHLKDPQRLSELHDEIERRERGWIIRTTLAAVILWLLQSRLLSGSWGEMWERIQAGYVMLSFDIGPLFVWLTMNVAMSALLQNALLFRRLVPHLNVDILEPDSYLPIGSMAVTSTLVVLGAMALLAIMWLGGPIDWWTTLPALVFFTPVVVLLLLLPVWPLHRVLKAQRQTAIADAQMTLRAARQASSDADGALAKQAAALTLRRELVRLPVWPFDVGSVLRFTSYAIIVPLTWAGAALIEMLVTLLLE
ncbi:MAG: hypothetical protein AAGA44_09710 [Pseudomonadota bacterium]